MPEGDSTDLLIESRQRMDEYVQQTGCRLCRAKGVAICELIDEFIVMHEKAHDFVDAIDQSKYLKLIGD